MHAFYSSLTKFLSMKSVQTRFVAPQNLSIDTCLIIKVIISYNNFLTIDQILNEKIWGMIIFSDFH